MLVESLIVLPVFITLFVLGVFGGEFYRSKLESIHRAKQEAFKIAATNCQSTYGFQNVRIERFSLIDMAFGMATNIIMGAPWTSVFTKPFQQTILVREGRVTSMSDLYGGPVSISISTKTEMTCNEKPESISLLQVFLWAYAKLAPFG